MTTATLTGHVTYLTREALPPVALVVELHDLSIENKEAKLVASTSRAVPACRSMCDKAQATEVQPLCASIRPLLQSFPCCIGPIDPLHSAF